MNDSIAKLDQSENEILGYDVSDEALEAAAGTGNAEPFTLGACTGLSVCPS
jgi:hypothetical protein